MLKGVPYFSEIRFWNTIRKLEGSTVDDLCLKRDMLSNSALTKGKFVPNCDGSWHRKGGITLRPCDIEFI